MKRQCSSSAAVAFFSARESPNTVTKSKKLAKIPVVKTYTGICSRGNVDAICQRRNVVNRDKTNTKISIDIGDSNCFFIYLSLYTSCLTWYTPSTYHKRMRVFLLVLGLGVLLFDVFLFKNPDKQTVFNFLFNLAYAVIYLFGAIIALLKFRQFQGIPKLRKSMLFFSAGMFFYACGLIVWTYYNLVLKIPIPYPSLADVFFLLYYPGVIFGIYYMIRSFGSEITRKLTVEGVLVFVVFFSLLYVFLNQTSLGTSVPALARLLNVAYPLADSILITLAITVLRTEKGIATHPNILYFVLAFFLLATADTLFSYRSSTGMYWNGDISDFLFSVSGFITALGFLSFRRISLTNHSYR